MHFNWFFSAKANFKVCIEAQKISVAIFFHVNPYGMTRIYEIQQNFITTLENVSPSSKGTKR